MGRRLLAQKLSRRSGGRICVGRERMPSRVIRSGSWRKDSSYAGTSNRGSYDTNVRYPTHGSASHFPLGALKRRS
jgi:hypothetical protein